MQMIDKVIEAIEQASCHVSEGVAYGALPKSECRRLAVAAVKALQVPNHRMIERGCFEHLHAMSHGSTYQTVEAAFESMIAEVLDPGPFAVRHVPTGLYVGGDEGDHLKAVNAMHFDTRHEAKEDIKRRINPDDEFAVVPVGACRGVEVTPEGKAT